MSVPITAADVAARFPGTIKLIGNRYRGWPCPRCGEGSKDAFWAQDGDHALLVGCNKCAPNGGADFLREVLEKLGLTGGDVYFGPAGAAGRGADDTYAWLDKATGATVVQTRTASGDPKYKWPKGTRKAALVFLPRSLTGSGPLIVTEGAKAASAAALADFDVIGLTDDGAWKRAPAAAVQLFANRDVILWPDADEVGRTLMRRVAGHLARHVASVRAVDPAALPGAPEPLPKGWDAADWHPPAGTDIADAARTASADVDDQMIDPLAGEAPAGEKHPGARYLLLQDCPDVAAPVEWLWHNRIPRGRLTLLSGAPDAGKSMLAVAIAAAVSRWLALPDDEPRPAGSVVWIGSEDEDGVPMTAARLRAAGADPERVAVLQETPADFAVGILDATVAALDYKPDLAIVDSHVSWFEESFDGQAVRRELRAALGNLMKGGAAVILICHWRKQSVEDGPGHFRAAGSSGGLVGAARSQLDIEKLDGPARIMKCVKHSGAPESDDIRFNIVSAGLVGSVEWDSVTAHVPGSGGGRSAVDDRVLEYLITVAAPCTKSRICAALFGNTKKGSSSRAQRGDVERALWNLQRSGLIVSEKVTINGVERDGYRAAAEQGAASGCKWSQGAATSTEQGAGVAPPPKGAPPAAPCSGSDEIDPSGGDRQPHAQQAAPVPPSGDPPPAERCQSCSAASVTDCPRPAAKCPRQNPDRPAVAPNPPAGDQADPLAAWPDSPDDLKRQAAAAILRHVPITDFAQSWRDRASYYRGTLASKAKRSQIESEAAGHLHTGPPPENNKAAPPPLAGPP